MATVSVELSTEQVQQGLVYAQKVYPEATNAELMEMLEDAAYYGPGIRLQIADWEAQSTRQTENENRQVAVDEFNVVFPDAGAEPPPEPEPDPA